jgi:hypothetical protein
MWKKILLTSLILVLGVSLSFAATTGKISGRVVDAESGEPLPGANVLIDGTNQGGATDVDGYYFIINVRPGSYTVKSTMIGYQTITKTGVSVVVDRTSTVDFNLSQTVIEGQEVTIVAERAIVPLDVANSQTVIKSDEIIANKFKNVSDVIASQAGIGRVLGDERAPIRGSSFQESAFLVDGMALVDEISGDPNFFKVPLSAIQEINVITGGFNAEYGNVRSGLINVVTKDGGDQYSGGIDLKYSPAGLKHFDAMAFGHGSPIVDPFVNTGMGSMTGNDMFAGWNTFSGVQVDENGNALKDANGNFLTGNSESTLQPGEAHYGNPYERQALWLWRHRSMDNLDMLKDMIDSGVIDGDYSNTDDDDAVFEYGDIPDYQGELSFGGPVPFLKGVNFFTSYSTERTEYVYTLPANSFKDHNATAKISWQINPGMKLIASSLYGWKRGSNTNESGQGPGFGGYISNNPYQRLLGNKQWYPHCQAPGKQYRIYGGLQFTHQISPKTFYEVYYNASYTDYEMDQYFRNTAPIAGSPYGDNYLESGEIGSTAEANERARLWTEEGDVNSYRWNEWRDWAKVRIGDVWYDEGPWGFGRTQYRDVTDWFRMSSCNLRIDESYSRKHNVKANITSQMNRFNQVKAGFELAIDDIHEEYGALDPSVNGGSRQFVYVKPLTLGAYVQDKLEFQGMIANVGLRFDYLRTGEFIDLNDDPTDKVGGPYATSLEANNYFTQWKDPSWATTSHFYVSPRIGISHPISKDSKIFFNYGHFYKWNEANEMYLSYQSMSKGFRTERLGNIHLKPPRTIQYEIGYTQSILDLARIEVTGYYKDITDEVDDSRFRYINGFEYRTYTNSEYEDTRGFEARLDFPGTQFISGWINYNYMLSSSGEYGYYRFYEDPNAIPQRRSTGVSQAHARPETKANIAFHTPTAFGPALAGYNLFEDMSLAFLFYHKEGRYFTWNPDGLPYVVDNKQWKNYSRSDVRFTKRLFRWKNIEPQFFVDVENLFNQKHLPNPSESDENFGNERVWNSYSKWFSNEWNEYMYSLKDGDRPGEVEGDHIDLPDMTPFLFYGPRDIFFGFRLNFMF